MARTRDPIAHATRRDEFIDVAERLIATQGYGDFTIDDILREAGASKGAFYHYFGSKQDLLEAVIERMTDVVLAAVGRLIDDPAMTAPEKLRGLFGFIASWKSERKEFVLGLLRVWFSDENALVRDRVRTHTLPSLRPLLARIVRQGDAEGSFHVTSPDDTASVLVALLQGSNESASRLFVARQEGSISFEEVKRAFAAYEDAFDRILGADERSIRLVDDSVLQYWFGDSRERNDP